MAAKKPTKITANQVEDLKDKHSFDLHLARAIVPLAHPHRHIVDHDVLCQPLVDAIREVIDFHLSPFVASGGRKIPQTIYTRKPPRARRPFSPRPQLETLLRSFLDKCLTELRQKKPKRDDLRRVTRQAHRLIVAIIRRDPRLAKFVTY